MLSCNRPLTRQALAFTTSSLLAVALAGGCGTTREAKWDDQQAPKADAAPDAGDRAAALIAEGDALWAERLDKAKLQQAIAKWEEAATLSESADLAVKLSRGHYLLADGHFALEGDVENRDAHYTKGLDWAEKAIQLTAPEFVAAVKAGEKHRDAIKKAPKEAVPGMYWYATNMGKWATSKGFATVLRYKDDIKATMDHVMALDSGYFYAAPYRYFGAYEARTAGIAGGSLQKSEEAFQKSVELAPHYLATKVLWAEYLCPKQGEGGKETAKRLLEEVIAADPNALPDVAPENTIEQKKAKALLAKLDEMF